MYGRGYSKKRNYGGILQAVVVIAIVVIIAMAVLWMANLLFGVVTDFQAWFSANFVNWWLEPVTDAANAGYTFLDDLGTAMGGVGLDGRTTDVTIGEKLATGIINTVVVQPLTGIANLIGSFVPPWWNG